MGAIRVVAPDKDEGCRVAGAMGAVSYRGVGGIETMESDEAKGCRAAGAVRAVGC